MLSPRIPGCIIGRMPNAGPNHDAAPPSPFPGSNSTLLGKPLFLALALAVATFVAYIPAFRAGFIWDDDSWTTGCSQLLRDLSGLRSMWCHLTALQQYYPLTGTTFWLDYHLWGLWPLPYHVENVLLHTLAAILFWRLLCRLEVPGAWLAGAIFALHPVMVESAAWITERKNVLSLVLYLGALLVYGQRTSFWKAEDDSSHGAEHCPAHWGWYGLAWLLALGALLAKTTAFSLPAVVLLICWWKRGRIRWRGDMLPTAPFFVLAIGVGLVTAWLERTHVGANGPEWAIPFPERCLIAGRALVFYTGKLLWPANLCFVYPRWSLDAHSLPQWLYPCIAGGTVLGLWAASKRIGRGPAAAALFFVGTLFPVLGFMNAYFMRYSFVCDHWVYLPSLGPVALAAAGIATAFKWFRRRPAVLESTVCGTLLLVLAALTWRQGQLYRDSETLWRDTLTKNPRCSMAHNNLGLILMDQDRLPEAKEQGELSVLFNPQNAEAHSSLGLALARLGRQQEAIRHYQQALQIEPDLAEAHYNLALASARLGRLNDAIAHYEQALRLKPFIATAHNNLGNALLRTGNLQEAIRHYEQAVYLKPDFVEAHYNLGVALQKAGRLPEAIAQYKQVVRAKPDYEGLDMYLGYALLQQGESQEAIAYITRWLQIKPDDAEAHGNLGAALIAAGRPQEAAAHLERALRMRPDLAEAQNNLAWLLATLPPAQGGDRARAVNLAQQACQLTGDHSPGNLDTLAVAYAAAGRFEDAVATAQKAIALAQAAGETNLLKEIEARLELYRSGQPYRELANKP
jgi:protein O-mannosyl-transferase